MPEPAVSVNDNRVSQRGRLRSPKESRAERDGARCMSLDRPSRMQKMLPCHRMGRRAAAARRGGDPVDSMKGALGGDSLCRS